MRTTQEKITTREELAPKVAQWRSEGKTVGFTSGAFDIVHAGHISYLEEAKKVVDILIVGVNTDESVKEYKGPDRPIVAEQYRAEVMAGLEAVDYVFTFSERRNRKNIETLKPTHYLKAGDYKKAELTSSGVIEELGGETVILPLAEGLSTSNIINRIVKVYGGKEVAGDETVKAAGESRDQHKAVIIDRDGTINEEVEYLHEPEKFKLTPNAGEGLKKMQELGYKIVVVTVQAGIGLGYFTKEDFYKVNREMFQQLKPYDIVIDKIYFDVVGKTKDGKNPKEALIERAREELDLNLSESFVIGDKTGDLAAGENYGSKKIGMKTGHNLADGRYEVTPDYMAADLQDAADWIEKQESAN